MVLNHVSESVCFFFAQLCLEMYMDIISVCNELRPGSKAMINILYLLVPGKYRNNVVPQQVHDRIDVLDFGSCSRRTQAVFLRTKLEYRIIQDMGCSSVKKS